MSSGFVKVPFGADTNSVREFDLDIISVDHKQPICMDVVGSDCINTPLYACAHVALFTYSVAQSVFSFIN